MSASTGGGEFVRLLCCSKGDIEFHVIVADMRVSDYGLVAMGEQKQRFIDSHKLDTMKHSMKMDAANHDMCHYGNPEWLVAIVAWYPRTVRAL